MTLERRVADWNAAQYLKFADERTRPARDLLARVAIAEASSCVDLGCGPGNSTELLVERFPQAEILGLDSSPDMIAAAQARLPGARFELADLARWQPLDRFTIVFANAVLQWLPDHASLLPRLAGLLMSGGALAVQMPDNLDEPSHVLMRETAARGPWAATLAGAAAARGRIGSFEEIYGWLAGQCDAIDLWRTTYVHPLDGPAAIVEWLKGTGLHPYLDPLDQAQRQDFLRRYEAAIADAYPRQADGKVLLRFPRLFIVARRKA